MEDPVAVLSHVQVFIMTSGQFHQNKVVLIYHLKYVLCDTASMTCINSYVF
jgi:hypothetical protein